MLCPVAFFGSLFLKFNFGGLAQGNDSLWEVCIRNWISPFVGTWFQGDRMKRFRIVQGSLPSHLVLALKILKRWDVRMSELATSPRRQLYHRVIRDYFAVPLALRDCVGDILQESLRYLNGKRLPPKFFDNCWLSLQGKLYVRGNLNYLSIGSKNCPWECGVEETQEHFLVSCPVTRDVYDQLAASLKVPFLNNLTYTESAYGVSARQHLLDRETLYIIIACTRYQIWQQRCRRTFGYSGATPDNIVRATLVQLSFLKENDIRRSNTNEIRWRGLYLSLS
ncbi:hypothetical protein XENTR_v10013163 [Xenopus tropicalis]|nr:hypothetical protein XENTR_v10013163 [Xenopus tropicalis]